MVSNDKRLTQHRQKGGAATRVHWVVDGPK